MKKKKMNSLILLTATLFSMNTFGDSRITVDFDFSDNNQPQFFYCNVIREGDTLIPWSGGAHSVTEVYFDANDGISFGPKGKSFKLSKGDTQAYYIIVTKDQKEKGQVSIIVTNQSDIECKKGKGEVGENRYPYNSN